MRTLPRKRGTVAHKPTKMAVRPLVECFCPTLFPFLLYLRAKQQAGISFYRKVAHAAFQTSYFYAVVIKRHGFLPAVSPSRTIFPAGRRMLRRTINKNPLRLTHISHILYPPKFPDCRESLVYHLSFQFHLTTDSRFRR